MFLPVFLTAALLQLAGPCAGEAEAVHHVVGGHPGLPHHGLPHHGYGGYEAAGYCANGGSCVPPVFCSPNYLESLYDPAAPCYLAHGTPGVCCLPRKHPCE